jgi:hypothetical protein
MHVTVHPASQLLKGDDSYHARNLRVMPASPETEIIEGIYVDDGYKPEGGPRRPDRPFRFLVPVDGDYSNINVQVFDRLRRGESLMNLDFSLAPQR